MDKQAARGMPFLDGSKCSLFKGVISESAMCKRRDEVEPRDEEDEPDDEDDDDVGEMTSSLACVVLAEPGPPAWY